MDEEQNDKYVERFDQNGVHLQLRECLQTISKLKAANPDETNDLKHLAAGIERAQKKLSAVDKAFAGRALLKEAHRAANQIAEFLKQFIGDHNAAHLASAIEQLEAMLLPAIARMPRIEAGHDLEPFFAAIDEQRSRLATELKKQVELIQNSLRDTEAYGATVRSTIDTIIANRSKVDEAISKQDDRLNQLIKRTDDALSEFNARSVTAERDRDTTARERLDDIRKQVDEQLETTRKTASDTEAMLTRNFEQSLKKLAGYEAQARSLLQIIGDHGITAPFDKSAKADRRAAFGLRALAGLAFAGMVGTIVWTAVDLAATVNLIATTPGTDLDWKLLLFRFTTALIFAVPAFYFAREATQFQENANRHRRMQLELASIAPFIDGLEPATRDALRLDLAKRYFGNAEVPKREGKTIDMTEARKTLAVLARIFGRK
jgi:hypothetical protein